ncbi:hypothetical protein [Atlantibacter hermannii]
MPAHTVPQLLSRFPLLHDLIALREIQWFNPAATSLAEGLPGSV